MNQVVNKFKDYKVEQLESASEQLQEAIEAQFLKNNLILEGDARIQLERLLCRAQEWSNKAFFVIVVGPVKAGKSTLVNLLAHAKVSPTHYLECTVRPSIISRRKDETQDCTITSYLTDGEPTMELVDSIIDCVKGYEFANLERIKVEEPCLLNKKNLDDKVAYRIGFDIHENGKVALTSITAPGGDFLQNDIYLIDMPGFDGVKANINDSFYEAVVSRADLVIFVQSSNSAINKISEQFCSILTQRNASVPMLFIHNYFEASYWHTEQERNQITDGHIEKAREFFKEMNVTIDKDCFHRINLGKVTDARDIEFRNCEEKCLPGYDADLDKADKEFKEIEEIMHRAISSSQGKMRLINCINRTASELMMLKKKIEDRVAVLSESKTAYENVMTSFDDAITHLTKNTCDNAEYISLSPSFKEDLVKMLLENCLSPSVGESEFHPDREQKYWCSDIRKTATNIINRYVLIVKRYLEENINQDNILRDIRRDVFEKYSECLSEPLKTYTDILKQINLSDEHCYICFSNLENYYNVEDRIGHTIARRKGAEVWNIYKQIESEYVGRTLQTAYGYIPMTFLPNVEKEMKNWVERQYKKYCNAYAERLERIKQSALPKLPANIEDELKQDNELINTINQLLKDIGVTNEA